MPTPGQILERNARHSPHGAALVYRDRRWTHSDYASRVKRLAHALAARGARRGDRIALLAMNCSEYLEVYGACEWAGYVLGAVNFRLAPPEVAFVVDDLAPRVVVFEEQYAGMLAGLRADLPEVEKYVCIGGSTDWAEPYEALLESGDPAGPDFRAREEDYLCIIYTSGTTGKPKGVVHTNRSYARLAEILSAELKLDGDGRMLAIAPLFHIGARSLASAQQWQGGTIVLHRGFDAAEVIRTIERERITAIHLVPTMVQALLDAPEFGRHDLSSLKMLMYAAAPMPVPLLERALRAFGPILVNGYGQTEINLVTLLHAHQHRPEAAAHRLGSVGQPHPRSEVRIVDAAGLECPAGSVGEILARSETAMAGYWNRSAATLQTVRDGWVHTGDMGYLDDEGYLFLVDRKKDMIISGGENIYSREVEEAVARHPAVREVAVVGVPDPHWGEAVKAVVVLKPHAQASALELIAFCKDLIASYKCPKSVEFTAALPRLPTGKVSKLALRERYASA